MLPLKDILTRANNPLHQRSQGDAQSAVLIGMQVKDNPSFIALRKIEAAREIAHTIASSGNRVYLPSDSLLLNVNEHASVDQSKAKK